jgi:hypothetical protein
MSEAPAYRPEILQHYAVIEQLYERDPVALIELSWALEHYTGEEDLRGEGMDFGYFDTLQQAGLITPEGKITEDVAEIMGQCFGNDGGTWTLYPLPPVVQVFGMGGGGPSGTDEPF